MKCFPVATWGCECLTAGAEVVWALASQRFS